MLKRKIEIISECGVNFNGDISLAIDMIKKSKEAGADIVKFQIYDPNKRPDIETHPHKEILISSRLKPRDLAILKDESYRIGIEFMCSVFDVDKVQWLEEIGVKRYKIGSKSLYNIELIKEIEKTKKPIIMSLGLLNDDISKQDLEKYNVETTNEAPREVWTRLQHMNNTSFLYCNFQYPCPIEEVNFDFDTFTYFDGFSDHTVSIFPSIYAMSLGARIIEKHVTLSKDYLGPDHRFSINFDELALLCLARDDIERMIFD